MDKLQEILSAIKLGIDCDLRKHRSFIASLLNWHYQLPS